MKVKLKYKLGSTVKRINNDDEPMIVSYVSIYRDKTYTYGCLQYDGTYKSYSEYELIADKSSKSKLGFNVNLQHYEE